MNASERRRHARSLDALSGQDHVARRMAEREAVDPSIARKKQSYRDQAQAIEAKLRTASLSPGKRQRLEWNLAVLNYRAENGPRIHVGYYDINQLPDELEKSNPQLKQPVEEKDITPRNTYNADTINRAKELDRIRVEQGDDAYARKLGSDVVRSTIDFGDPSTHIRLDMLLPRVNQLAENPNLASTFVSAFTAELAVAIEESSQVSESEQLFSSTWNPSSKADL